MRSNIQLISIGLFALKGVSAAPATTGAYTPVVFARDYTGFDSCSDDQKKKINQALQDAAIMARQVTVDRKPDGGDTQSYTSSSA